MKILEVRDGFIKFEADKTIGLSSFVKINGAEKSYVAQVIQLKISGEHPIAYSKILFLYQNGLMNYDKTLPPPDAQIEKFTQDVLKNSVYAAKPVIAGKTYTEKLNITIDSSAFDKKMLVSVDDKESNNLIVKNLTKQFNNLNKNVVIIDTLGIINAKKYTAGVDFKLPLNTESLAFMYKDCLNDATSDSKSLIVEIFRDLAEYSTTTPFLPFEALKTIVDDMVDNSHVFKLLVLKNKLAKFDKLGYFAKNFQEVKSLNHILNSKCVVLDLSKLDSAFLNHYLSFIYSTLNENFQVFLETSNIVSKRNLKNILSDNKISTTMVTHSRFKYLNDIKNLFDNFIITPSVTNNEVFSIYKTFLNSMPKNTYLLTGEAENYIPLVASLEPVNDLPPVEPTAKEDITPTEAETLESEPLAEKSNSEDNANEEIVLPSDDSVQDEAENEIINDAENEIEPQEPEIITEEEPEPDVTPKYSTEEILAGIEEKSNNAIEKVAEDLTVPQNLNMFGDEEIENTENSGLDELNAIAEETDIDNIVEPHSEIIPEYEEPEIIQDAATELETSELTLNEALEHEISDDRNVDDAGELTLQISDDEPEFTADYLEDEEIQELPFSDDSDLDELTDDTNLTEQEQAPDVEELDFAEDLSLQEEVSEELSIEIDDTLGLELEEDTDLLSSEIQTSGEDTDIMQISGNDDDLDEFIELNPDEANENDIIIDMDSPAETSDDIDEQIVKDVDKVFTTRKDEGISDSDLDFIDELNNGDNNLLEELSDENSVLEELSDEENGVIHEPEKPSRANREDNEVLEKKNSTTPMVPVFDADIPPEDMVISDPIASGDTVTHAKYGAGVVEKMIKYGNKTLFSINFDNVGRRLLDPTLTEIKKA